MKRNADQLRLKGWVKNLPDGRVEAIVEGEQTNLDVLIQRCWNGPALSLTRNVEVHVELYTGSFRDFKIRY